MARPRTVYRGKRRHSWIITLTASILVVLLLGLLWLFSYLQRFIVYDKDGLHLDLSAGGAPTSADPDDSDDIRRPDLVDVDIVVEAADYAGLVTSAGRDVPSIQSLYVPADGMNESNLGFYIRADLGDYNAMVLELKAPDGFLRYRSSVGLTDSYAVNGSLDLTESIAALKEKGVYLCAQISALCDAAMAQRNPAMALRDADSGSIYADSGAYYLDPYAPDTRNYLRSLLTELRDMGFDEVLLADFLCPDDPRVRFSQEMSLTPTAADALNSLALWLREQADALGLRLSVMVAPEGLRAGEIRSGQDPAVLGKAFDRLAVETDPARLEFDLSALGAAIGVEGGPRVVSVTSDYAPDADSYIVK